MIGDYLAQAICIVVSEDFPLPVPRTADSAQFTTFRHRFYRPWHGTPRKPHPLSDLGNADTGFAPHFNEDELLDALAGVGGFAADNSSFRAEAGVFNGHDEKLIIAPEPNVTPTAEKKCSSVGIGSRYLWKKRVKLSISWMRVPLLFFPKGAHFRAKPHSSNSSMRMPSFKFRKPS